MPAASITRLSEASWNPWAANSSTAARRITCCCAGGSLANRRSDHGIAGATQAAAKAGSSMASWKLLPIARSATFGSPISLITVFRTRSWSLFLGANARPRPTRGVLLGAQERGEPLLVAGERLAVIAADRASSAAST